MKNYFLDIETFKYNETNKCYEPILDTNFFYLGCILGKEPTYYLSPRDMWLKIKDISARTRSKVSFWAHNHQFDFYGYIKHTLKDELRSGTIKIIRSNPLIAILNDKDYLIDTMALKSGPLEDIGELYGYPKLKMPKQVNSPFELYSYITRDCQIVKEIVESNYIEMQLIAKKLGLGTYKPRKLLTAPSMAMNLLIKYINAQDKSGWLLKAGKLHKYPENIKFLRLGMKGGRVEALKKGIHKNATIIDIHSAYWKAMTQMPFPDLLRERRLKKDMIELLGYDEILNRTGVIKCSIQVKENKIGLLGIRYNKNPFATKYKLIFPNIEGMILNGYWTTTEINFAIKHGYKLIDIDEAVIYDKDLSFNYVSEFIKKIWDLKKNETNKIKKSFYKLIGNSLYGKFIQKKKDKDYLWIKRENLVEYTENGWEIESVLDDYCISKEKEDYTPRYLSIILGALITAYGRVILTKEMLKFEKNNLLYCDTDSIIFKGKKPKNIIIGDKLGEFKIEGEGEANIIKQKTYIIGDSVKVAGLPKKMKTKEIVSKKERIKILNMIGYKEASRRKNFELLGTFEEKEFSLVEKEEEELPIIINEVQ